MQVQSMLDLENAASQHSFGTMAHATPQLHSAFRRVLRPAAWPGLSTPRTIRPPPREFFIQGITLSGRSFRPSDWAERLAGALSSFRPPGGIGAHIGYSPYCTPQLIDGIKCVVVNEDLRDLEPMAWDFAMNFARDNALQVIEACLLVEAKGRGQIGSALK